MLLPLSNGGHAIIDDELFEQPLVIEVWKGVFHTFRICERTWRHKDSYRVPYVQCFTSINYRKCTIRLHRLVLQANHGTIVDHINRDVLDNRRSNLRLCNHQTNNQNRRRQNRNRNGIYTNELTGQQFKRQFDSLGKETLLPLPAVDRVSPALHSTGRAAS